VAVLLAEHDQLGLAANVDRARHRLATVLAAGGSPKGVVNFMDGSTMPGMAAVGFDQTASLLVDLAPGEHTLTALYQGGDGFSVSASAPVRQQINDSTPVPPRRRASRP
jgi:hypothetical protein